MKSDDLVTSDLQELAATTSRGVPSLADTSRALGDALAGRTQSAGRRRLRAPVLVGAFAAAAAVALVPVPYRHQVGWDATIRSANGRVATVHVAARDAAEAQRRAETLGHAAHAQVSLAPRTELVWGSVYAMAREQFFHVNVDLNGKTDAEAEAEIRAQIVNQGWTPGDVEVKRGDGTAQVSVGADDGDGRHFQMVQRTDGAKMDRVEIAPEPIDDAREPGMTDAQLRDKILRQFKARGIDAEVTVEGDKIEVQARKSKTAP